MMEQLLKSLNLVKTNKLQVDVHCSLLDLAMSADKAFLDVLDIDGSKA